MSGLLNKPSLSIMLHHLHLFSFVVCCPISNHVTIPLRIVSLKTWAFMNELKTQSKNSQGCHHTIWNGRTNDEAKEVCYARSEGSWKLPGLKEPQPVSNIAFLSRRIRWFLLICTEMDDNLKQVLLSQTSLNPFWLLPFESHRHCRETSQKLTNVHISCTCNCLSGQHRGLPTQNLTATDCTKSEKVVKLAVSRRVPRESTFKGTPLDSGSRERLRRLRFSVALSGCEQNKTARSEIYQRHRHLNLPLDQKFHLLPQAHHSFEINLM